MVLRRIFKGIGQRVNPVRNFDKAGSEGDICNGVKIIRSNRRKRTISARLIRDTMTVYAPADIPDAELKKAIGNFKSRLHKRKLKMELDETQDLKAITEKLNNEYFRGRLEISSIEYTTNQDRLFGCCNHRTRKIRISHRLVHMPHWVRDYVIIHEMAHLIEPNHSRAFWDIVSRYKLTERARGYLMAKGLDSEEEPGDIEQAD